ncbi:unnamed protein product [Coregonus sp. 'balchen']|nr:unnamed protein product [Coregonus sp. 'balchen']
MKTTVNHGRKQTYCTAYSVSCEDLTPLKKEEFCLEGTPVTLSYNYSRTATDTAQRPEFLLYISGSGFIKKADPLTTRISAKLNEEKKRLELEMTGSALYYCSVRPTVTGNLNTLYNKKKTQKGPHQQEVIWLLF